MTRPQIPTPLPTWFVYSLPTFRNKYGTWFFSQQASAADSFRNQSCIQRKQWYEWLKSSNDCSWWKLKEVFQHRSHVLGCFLQIFESKITLFENQILVWRNFYFIWKERKNPKLTLVKTSSGLQHKVFSQNAFGRRPVLYHWPPFCQNQHLFWLVDASICELLNILNCTPD